MPSNRAPTSVVSVGGGPQPPGGFGGGAAASAALTNHINDPVGAHAASAISYAGGPAWADLTANPASNAEAQLDKLVSDLATGDGANKIRYNGVGSGFADGTGVSANPLGLTIDTLASTLGSFGLPDGATKIGVRTIVNAPITISGGTLRSFLTTLALASGIKYSSASTFRNGDVLADASVQTTIDAIVSEYNSTSSGNSGAHNIGIDARTSWLDGTTNILGSVFTAVNKIITDLNLQTVNLSGAQKIGIDARSNWLDGLTNPATNTAAAVKKIITDLIDQTGVGANGSSRIGFAPQGNISSNTVESAIAELDTEKGGLALANTWTTGNTFQGTNTFTGQNNFSGGNGIVLSGASNRVRFGSNRVHTRVFSAPGNPDNNANWTIQPDGSFVQVNTGHTITWGLDLPDNCFIEGVTVWVQAAVSGTHPSNLLNVTKPQINLYQMNSLNGVSFAIGTANDPSTTKAQYEAYHAIVMGNMTGGPGNLNLNVDRTDFKWALTISGEAGTNFVAGLQVYAIAVGFLVTEMDDAPC